MKSDKYCQSKKKILEQIAKIIDSELTAIDSPEQFDELLNRENALIAELTELDKKSDGVQLTETQIQTLADLLYSINSRKKQVIGRFREKFDALQKNDLFINNQRGLFNTYFQKIPINPRFIDTNK